MRATILLVFCMLFQTMAANSRSFAAPGRNVKSVEVRTQSNNLSSTGYAVFDIYLIYDNGERDRRGAITAKKDRDKGTVSFIFGGAIVHRNDWYFDPSENKVYKLFSGDRYSCSSVSEAVQIIMEKENGL